MALRFRILTLRPPLPPDRRLLSTPLLHHLRLLVFRRRRGHAAEGVADRLAADKARSPLKASHCCLLTERRQRHGAVARTTPEPAATPSLILLRRFLSRQT